MKSAIIKSLLFFTVWVFTSCSKSKFLDAKPKTSINVPSTLTDFQALMDNYNTINQSPGLGDISADNYFLDYGSWQSIDVIGRNCYTWAKDPYGGIGNIQDWDLPYQQVLVANIVLEGLASVSRNDDSLHYDFIKGSAYFIRGKAFFDLLQCFAPPFDSATASADPGIPLKLSSNVNDMEIRSSVKDSYEQLLGDLKNARTFLHPIAPSANINRPNQPAAMALLSRVFLSMRNYAAAGAYADSCLQLYSTLMDYNSLDSNSYLPFARTNAETMFQCFQNSLYEIDGGDGYAQVDSVLYGSYEATDMRRSLFYYTAGGGHFLKATYNGTFALFSGLATNEMFLNRAECNARLGNIPACLHDLDALLSKRYLTGTYTPKSAATADQALALVLTERRKELPFSGVRWSDLRRLNKEGANIMLQRMLNGQTYSLPPNSDLYVLPIPSNEVEGSGITQNPR
jgi:starch-binding outer membrane protein, SusD/RagB family